MNQMTKGIILVTLVVVPVCIMSIQGSFDFKWKDEGIEFSFDRYLKSEQHQMKLTV